MTALAGVPIRRITRAIADAAARWSDADFPPRARILDRIAERTGYSVPVVEYALDRLFFALTREGLEAAITAELGTLEILDDFAPAGATRARALPVGNVCVIASRTTIGVAIVPAMFALCAKCDVLVKDREDALAGAFFSTLAEELDEFAVATQARCWDSASGSGADVGPFDAVVAFGSDETLKTIAAQCGARARFTGYGSRASAGYVGLESLRDDREMQSIARGAARDLALYETEGCLSLHVLFVEGTADDPRAQRFLHALDSALEEAAVEFPAGKRDAAREAQAAQAHRLAAFRAANGRGSVYGAHGSHALIVEPPADDAPLFLPRTLAVRFVRTPHDALDYLRSHAVPLEAMALSSRRDDVVDLAMQTGASRVVRFGEMQNPPIGVHHGGYTRIAHFVRWFDDLC